ncbi:MAG: EAL domain-containing protein [Xanthomonadaceae bacterium]|nr:EAL domain-containing protein [Xanthomonadaceae bacterium]MDE3073240.1 EAL domain-containing protein [Pseudomonadota bacterium]
MKSGSSTNRRIDILVAGESPAQAEKLQCLFEEHGYTVATAADGKQALAAARRHKPALIVSDALMPEMDGFALCGEIRRDGTLNDVPVILLATLSDTRDIVRGLECGADGFIRKPYEDRHLLARVDGLLTNNELRRQRKMPTEAEIRLGGQTHVIAAGRQQIADLLISLGEEVVHLGEELQARQREVADSNGTLTGLYHIAEGLNRAATEREVCDQVLEHAMELPRVQAGWISLWENGAFRMAAARNLPPALQREGAMDGLCDCRRRFVAGELDQVSNTLECERLKRAEGDTCGLRYHASVPLWSGERMLGIMNLVGADQGLFKDSDLATLFGVGHQVGVALERTRLHGRLEQLVEERTAALTAEIDRRKRIQEEQARLVAIIEATPDLVGTANPDGRFLYLNQAGLRMLGAGTVDELGAQRIKDRHPEWAGRLVLEEGIPHAISHGTWSGETAFLRRDGSEVPVLQVIIAHKHPDGSLAYMSTTWRDITERKAYEARIVRLNRIYSVLSGINTTIVRVRARQELFDEACRIAVEHGKFVFAWIGMFDADTQQVTAVAKAGHDDGYLAQANRTATAGAAGDCQLTARALTRCQPVVCNDIATDEAMQSLRAEALRRGYRSAAVFPLIMAGQPIGLFALHASEANVFDDEEMRLLTEMAGDVSFALDHLEKVQRLDYLAYYDAVTGLPNRTLFQDRVAQKINRAHRAGEVFSVIMLDLNRFSSINETLGRQVGDDVLRLITRRLQGMLGETDVLARFSADHFGIAVRHDNEGPDIAHLMGRILSGIQNQPFRAGGQDLRVSARAGVASYPVDGEDIETLLRNAEAALKKAKLSGDRYLFYAPAFNALVAGKLLLENKLRRALEQGQLVLHYQPKVDLGSGRISGLEALMRWDDPEVGMVFPLQFIPLLEETGMILEAGQWALEQAVADSLAWQAKGLPAPRVAVNVSPIQLQQDDFVGMLERVVKGDRDVAGRLELEITESLVMRDIVANIRKLRAIREMGVTVAIDDFGTGYSSLSYIARLPAGTLKIDQAFIADMTRNPDGPGIVSTIISLAHSLNMQVVAEGVETVEQARLLRSLKCDAIQGFLFSPAVPASQIEEFLREGRSLSLA